MRPYRNYFREFLDNVKNCQKEIIEMFEEFNVNEITFPKDVVYLCRNEEEYIFFDNIKKMKCNAEYNYLSVITENDEEHGLFEYEYDDILSVYDEVYCIFDNMSEGRRK